jgi:hypothetical protein
MGLQRWRELQTILMADIGFRKIQLRRNITPLPSHKL